MTDRASILIWIDKIVPQNQVDWYVEPYAGSRLIRPLDIYVSSKGLGKHSAAAESNSDAHVLHDSLALFELLESLEEIFLLFRADAFSLIWDVCDQVVSGLNFVTPSDLLRVLGDKGGDENLA